MRKASDPSCMITTISISAHAYQRLPSLHLDISDCYRCCVHRLTIWGWGWRWGWGWDCRWGWRWDGVRIVIACMCIILALSLAQISVALNFASLCVSRTIEFCRRWAAKPLKKKKIWRKFVYIKPGVNVTADRKMELARGQQSGPSWATPLKNSPNRYTLI